MRDRFEYFLELPHRCGSKTVLLPEQPADNTHTHNSVVGSVACKGPGLKGPHENDAITGFKVNAHLHV